MTDSEPQQSNIELDNDNKPKNRPSRVNREAIFGGIGFVIFLTIVVVGINGVGIENLQIFIEDAGIWAPLIYIFVKAITYIFAPLTSGPIQVVAGTLFDNVWLGVLYTLIGEVIGGSISFWIARRFGRPVVERFVSEEGMQQVEDFYQNRMGGWVSLAAARVILFVVWDFLSYAAGLAESVKFRSYLLVSIVFGFIPTFFFVWIGDAAVQDPRILVLAYAIVVVMVLVPVLARKQIERFLQWTVERDKAKRGKK